MKKIAIILSLTLLLIVFVTPTLAHCGKDGLQCPDSIVTEKQKDGSYVIHEDDVKLFSKFPMRYDPASKSFFVLTGNGKEVQVKATPKKAEEIAYITGMLNEFEYVGEDKKIMLDEKNGKLVYVVNGKKTGKLFGLWPVSYDVKAEIGEDGKLVSFEKPWILKILKYFIK